MVYGAGVGVNRRLLEAFGGGFDAGVEPVTGKQMIMDCISRVGIHFFVVGLGDGRGRQIVGAIRVGVVEYFDGRAGAGWIWGSRHKQRCAL